MFQPAAMGTFVVGVGAHLRTDARKRQKDRQCSSFSAGHCQSCDVGSERKRTTKSKQGLIVSCVLEGPDPAELRPVSPEAVCSCQSGPQPPQSHSIVCASLSGATSGVAGLADGEILRNGAEPF